MSAVRVNEIKVMTYTTGDTADWWLKFRAHHEPARRFTTVKVGVFGDVVDVACDDREHAEWLRNYLIERGVPKHALKVIA